MIDLDKIRGLIGNEWMDLCEVSGCEDESSTAVMVGTRTLGLCSTHAVESMEQER